MCTKYHHKKAKNISIFGSIAGLFVFLLILGSSLQTIAQTDEFANDPVSGTFETGLLAETQTVVTPFAGEFELHIQHRFGLIENGLEDVFGIYSSSNIRMGINYGITEKFMIGYGYTKDFKLQEFHGKYRVFTQTESNSIPVSVALYANLAINSQDEEVFGNDYAFSDRLAYFSQVLIAHKFNDNISLQFGPSFTHFNKTDTLVEHDKFALSLAGRAKVSPSMSVFFEYDQPLNIDDMREYDSDENDPEANLSFGIEIGTSTHVFQVFMSNYEGITPQRNTLYNKNKIGDGDFLVGFNILVRF
ncbi:DUF5777 family beta-barrel protein [Marinifilum caeruleilacunae]|uniref:DUF5777 domain-containing protein n=1 Tax=Marinifilum caeruleilacunae TaxID=2499076 RepID=A0ABX1X1E9_9BACT|nr:DUF5777 family beta-barrel protein [Marinifilum caeruleilacunae]NOU61913.1 hypothetical protein [Marinifilum caeruleilacunae]